MSCAEGGGKRGDPMGPMGRPGVAQTTGRSLSNGRNHFDGFDDSSDDGGSSGGRRGGGGGRRNHDEDNVGAGSEDSHDTSDHEDHQEENDEPDAMWADVIKRRGLSLWLHNAHEYCKLHYKCVPLTHKTHTHTPPQPTPSHA